MKNKNIIFFILVILNIIARIFAILLHENNPETPWLGGGDAPYYITLAENLVLGKGFAYGNQPTAFRPPLYPIMLAILVKTSGSNYVLLLRIFQFFFSLITVYLIALSATLLFGKQAWRHGILLGLYCPSLAYIMLPIGPENLAALFNLFTLYGYIRMLNASKNSEIKWGILSGISTGLSSLTRFTSPVILMIALYIGYERRSLRSVLIVITCFALIISPWLIRNRIVFGEWIYSTSGGFTLVKGILDPQGRGLYDVEVKRVLGWTHQEYERNDRSNDFPSELQMNAQALYVYFDLIKQKNISLIPLHIMKVFWFWLGFDHLINTKNVGFKGWIERFLAAIWWLWIGLSILGWKHLRNDPRKYRWAFLILWRVILATITHLPFTTSTRLRSPLMDPIVVVLAAGGSIKYLNFSKDKSQ